LTLFFLIAHIKALENKNGKLHSKFACSVVLVLPSGVGIERQLQIIDSWRKEGGKLARY